MSEGVWAGFRLARCFYLPLWGETSLFSDIDVSAPLLTWGRSGNA